ncbi:Uncharacterised protein [Yersinia mollaretii]|uniref:Uncharacterized protein n=1 Tax=Yersinia enterocolitica TaxID=630 RepID=A0ABM9S5M7_YEREN|nr:Uncharacterised protein [Yersinia enterocolitica]CQD71066.1 Uncharacterised protein [Yersinia enterocolitica]CQJ08270.1 Uncharacterised protein [Yersinia enterocolitica]CQJ12474.1 Uncharacterised protein [Yersinia mollaretii]
MVIEIIAVTALGISLIPAGLLSYIWWRIIRG